MTAFAPATRVAVDAVRRALDLATAGLGGSRVTAKGVRDVVTETDVAVEDLLRAAAGQAGIAVVGEERGGTAPDGAPYWLVDPLCGTTSFAMGIPLYSVNVAVVAEGVVVAAVVGDGSTGEVLVAERGRGAWGVRGSDLRPIATSDTSAAVVVEAGRSSGERRELAARLTAGAVRSDRWDVMALSSTVSLAYVAAGRVAAYVLVPTATLHVAAGTLLVSEAGGVVTGLDGRPWTFDSDGLVAAANASVHAGLLALLA